MDIEVITPFEDLSETARDVLLNGTNGKEIAVHYKGQRGEGTYAVAFEGLIKNVERRYRETSSETIIIKRKASGFHFINTDIAVWTGKTV